MNQAIKEHQKRCKKAIKPSNGWPPLPDFKASFKEWEKQDYLRQLKEDLKHINLDQYAGKTREIMEKLTKLVNL
jgi:hypothetical protein